MAIDTSMYANIQQPPNLLQQYGSVMGVANAMQQNRLMQQQQQMQQNQIDMGQLAVAKQRFDNLQMLIAPLVDNTNLSQKDLIGTMSDAIAQGLITPQQAAIEAKNFPDQDTPQANRQYALQHLLRFQSASDQAAQILGTNAEQNTGGQILNGVRQSPMHGGGFSPSTATPLTLPPTAPTMIAPGQPGYVGGTAAGGAPGTVPSGPPVGRPAQVEQAQGRYGQTLKEAANAQNEANIHRKIINLASSGAPTGTFLTDIYSQLAKAGLTSGTATDPAVKLQEIKKYMEGSLLSGGMPGSDARLSSLESANPTDKNLSEVIKNVSQYNLATTMLKSAKADALQKTVPDQNDPVAEEQFEKKWRDSADPRIIQVEMASPQERKSLLKTLTPQELQTLSKKRSALKDMGALDNLQ